MPLRHEQQVRPEPPCTHCGLGVAAHITGNPAACSGPECKPKPPEPQPDEFDPLAVEADWEDAEDIAYKVAEAARRHYQTRPGRGRG